MNIQWYPGHMAKTRRLLLENIKLVDIVIELLDARVPLSSQNPEFETIFNSKKRIKVFNKFDLADPYVNKQWEEYYSEVGIPCIFINSVNGKGFKKLYAQIEVELKEKFERDAKRGLRRRPIKAMVIGIPNVGKSTFINKISKKSAARTGDRPGVTKNKQWIKISDKIHFLDTPGILWPKFEDKEVGLNLAYTGAIKDEIMNVEELAWLLLEKLSVIYPESLKKRYNIDVKDKKGYEILSEMAEIRNFKLPNNKIDTNKMSKILLDEFRGSLLGNISLERP